MSEAEKKKSGDAAGSAERGDNVKPFPDFIAPPPPAGAQIPPPISPPGSARAAQSAPPPGSPVHAGNPPKPPKARGGGWAFLFALVSLTAAGISLSAPSLRPIAAERLKQQFGDQPWIGVVTGTADTRPPSVIELDLKQFDARLQALANTLTAANPGAPVDAAALERFADAAGATRRMEEFELALGQLKAGESERLDAMGQALSRMEVALAAVSQRAEAAEASAAALSEQLKAVETQAGRAVEIAEAADTGAKELATALGGMLRRLETAETGLTDLTGKLTELSADVGRQIVAALEPVGVRLDGLDKKAAEAAAAAAQALEQARNEIAVVGGNLAGLAEELKASQSLAATQADETKTLSGGLVKLEASFAEAAKRLDEVERAAAAQRGAVSASLLGLSNRLRQAVDEGEPFAAELNALMALANGDPAFVQPLAALAPLAPRGAPSPAYLRREFNVAARKIVEAEDAAQPAWYAKIGSNMQYYLGWGGGETAAPAATASGEPARTVLAQAANFINGGQFAEAVGVMATLQGGAADLAQPWMLAARARVTADQAARLLGAAALNRVGR